MPIFVRLTSFRVINESAVAVTASDDSEGPYSTVRYSRMVSRAGVRGGSRTEVRCSYAKGSGWRFASDSSHGTTAWTKLSGLVMGRPFIHATR